MKGGGLAEGKNVPRERGNDIANKHFRNFNFALRLVVSLLPPWTIDLIWSLDPAGGHYRPPFKTSSILKPVVLFKAQS